MSSSSEPLIVIIGAGLAGICMGIQLKRKFNYSNFIIVEKEKGIAGTWFVNTYPGCGCDVPTVLYQYSFNLKKDWTGLWVPQPELLAYVNQTVDDFGIRSNIHISTQLVSAIWNESKNYYDCSFKNLDTKEIWTREAPIVISAVGGLTIPRTCDIKGHESFKGKIFHSARWDHSQSLDDKNVVVIGNGCSAAQFVPVIAPKVKNVTMFFKEPQWIVYQRDLRPNAFTKFLVKIPGFYRMLRWSIFWILETYFHMFLSSKASSVRRKQWQRTVTKGMLSVLPNKYNELLVPTYEILCKRRIIDIDNNYLKTMQRDNVEATKDPIVEIKPDSVLTQSGRTIPADTIILATGFQMSDIRGPYRDVQIVGSNGKSLEQAFVDAEGPVAYQCTCVDTMPNFFIIGGANSLVGHTSVIFTIETQVDYILRLIKPIVNNKVDALHVTSKAEKDWMDWIDSRGQKLITSTGGCTSWYLNNGKNRTLYPDYQYKFWWNTLWPSWKDFSTKKGGKWEQ